MTKLLTNLERKHLAETIIADLGESNFYEIDHNCKTYDEERPCTRIESHWGTVEIFDTGEIYVNDRYFKNSDALYDVYVYGRRERK